MTNPFSGVDTAVDPYHRLGITAVARDLTGKTILILNQFDEFDAWFPAVMTSQYRKIGSLKSVKYQWYYIHLHDSYFASLVCEGWHVAAN